MIAPEELRHLLSGPRVDETPGGAGLVRVTATTNHATALLDRCREVLRVVLTKSEHDWPPLAVWAQQLPAWFVQTCAPDTTPQQDAAWLDWWRSLEPRARAEAASQRRWSLDNWLHWLQPAERTWYWWDGNLGEPDQALITVQVPGWPMPLGSLDWLLKVSGAESVILPEDVST